MIIEWPLNGQFQDVMIVIITSRMAVRKKFIMMAVIKNVGTFDNGVGKSRNESWY